MIWQESLQHTKETLSSHVCAFARFGTVGAVTAAIFFLMMWFANSFLGINYIAAVSVAYFVSTTFHYLANRHFTFRATEEPHGNQLIRYLAMWIMNYLLTIVIVRICVEQLFLSPYIGVCVSVVFTVLTGYVLARYWIFKLGGTK